jgi:membrane-associated PAP2 superfamily phosphatase
VSDASAPYSGFEAWLAHRSPPLIADPIAQCVVLVLVTTVVFLLFPGLDPWFSGLFYDPSIGFSMGRLAFWTAFRDFLRIINWMIPVALVAAIVIRIAWPWSRSFVSPRAVIFILSTLAVGPGIVTNLVFKSNWGRPRPAFTDLFGGNLPFVGIWRITDYCPRNCSFVSGEASAAIWLLTLVVLLPPAWHRTATKILIGLAVALSLNRIAMGGHFLSDVLMAWWLNLIVIAVLWRIIYQRTPDAIGEDRLEQALTDTGLAIRGLFARLAGRA